MSSRELERVHHGIGVGYPVGMIRRQLDAAPGRKAYEDCQEYSDDETTRDPAPKFGFHRRIELFGEFHDPGLPHWRVVGKAPPQPHPACRLARITPSNSSLSTGFWKKATAPDSSVRFSLPSGSRAVRTITGITESAGYSRKCFNTVNPSPAGSPRSRMIRWGRSF